MRRIVISAGIGIVAAGMLALPAMAASAAPSAASKPAWHIPGWADCPELQSEVSGLQYEVKRLTARLNSHDYELGNTDAREEILKEIKSDNDQIGRDEREAEDIPGCSILQ